MTSDERSRAAVTGWSLVPMTVQHLDAVMAHERDMFGTEAWTRNSYRSELADTARRYYLAAEDAGGELLGWGGVMVIGATAEILTVGVVPTARHNGAGRKLVAALLDEATDRGVTEVFLEVRVDNVAARALYSSEGFAELGTRRGYYDGGRVDAVTMRREIGPKP